MSNGDRTLLVPPHIGDHILPNLPFFEKLLRYASRSTPRIAIRDVNAGLEKTYAQLLVDGLALRKKLRQTLSPDIRENLLNDREVPIALLAPGGYEYAVGFIAILALGATVVPLSGCPASYQRVCLTLLQPSSFRQRKPVHLYTAPAAQRLSALEDL